MPQTRKRDKRVFDIVVALQMSIQVHESEKNEYCALAHIHIPMRLHIMFECVCA